MTLRIIYHELHFDWKYGIETRLYVENKDINTKSLNKDEGNKYGPLQIPFWNKVFDQNNINFDKSCYLDFGSGKGRTLILASLSGFQEIIGIEYGKELCEITKRNLIIFQSKHKTAKPIEIICMDALDFEIPDNATTIVFNDPFTPILLEKVVQNIKRSFNKVPREIHIVYFNYSEGHKKVLSQFEAVAEYKNERALICKYI